MKKYILMVAALLILASATLPGCSVEYRERHGHGRGHAYGHDRNKDRHYRNN